MTGEDDLLHPEIVAPCHRDREGSAGIDRTPRQRSGNQYGRQGISFNRQIEEGGNPAITDLVLGDRLDTDIAGGVAAGMASIMVLTGVNSRDDVAASPFKPTFVFDDLPALMRAWELPSD